MSAWEDVQIAGGSPENPAVAEVDAEDIARIIRLETVASPREAARAANKIVDLLISAMKGAKPMKSEEQSS